jgi:16S rRNA G1207 methylase RsmC
MSFPLSTWPREPPASQSEREMSLCSALEGGIVTPEQARDLAIPRHEMIAELAQRWIVHCQLRLEYERAMLAETGWTPPPRPKTKTDLPLLNYGGEVSYRNRWREGNTTGIAVGITKAEWAAIGNDYKGTERSACGTHRIRTAMHVRGDHGVQIVYITDSKQHPRPSAEAVATQAKAERAALDRELDRRTEEQQARAAAREANAPARAEREEARARIQELAGAIKAGVKVVSAPQLFPTPAPLAAQMVELLEVQDGDRVLEPSAGTGRLLQAIADARNAGGAVPAEVIAVEVSTELARGLHDQVPHLCSDVHPVNFLETDETKLGGRFERIVANPPFGGGADIQHIMHALSLLAPGGRLVALCAGGPRQETALRPRASSWEVLPEGSFAAEGTNVRVVLAVFDQP